MFLLSRHSTSKKIKAYISEFNIPTNKNKNFYNPSIIKYNGNIYTFHRECSSKHTLENIIKLLSKQIFVSSVYFTHNNRLTKIKIPNIEDMPKYKNIVNKNILIKGYEDPRAIIIQDKLVLVCSIRANSNKLYQVCLINIDLYKFINNSSSVLKCTEDNLVLLEPPMNKERSQKNWSPFVYNNTLHLVYSINPQIIFSCDINTGKIKKIIEKTYSEFPMNKIRGGSNLVDWKHPKLGDVFITIVHGKVKGFYYHLFYLCKKDYPFTILGCSDNFIFKNNCIEFIDISKWYQIYNVQFASTMIVINDYVTIGYGEKDCKSKKCIMKIRDVNKILKLF